MSNINISMSNISASRISNQAMRNQVTNQLNYTQIQMYRLETEISSGHQFQLPSENPDAALQVTGLQSMLERIGQLQTNISTSKNYLGQTDSTLTSASNLLTSIQSTALSAVGSTATASQRQSVIQQIDQTLQQMVALGNSQFNGQQLFGGMNTATPPFSINAAGDVVYSGTADPTQSFVDLNQLFATSITGDQAFGAMSQPIQGSSLAAAVSTDTPLSSLNGGRGVAPGSIIVSDGHSTSVVDLRSAKTLGDVATLIHQRPPQGRTVDVDVTSSNLILTLEPDPAFPTGDNLTVQDAGGNSTASDLGIASTAYRGNQPLDGQVLTATLTPNTPVSDLFGTTAQANIHFNLPNSDIVFRANAPGTASNGVTVQFDDTSVFTAGQEWTDYNPATSTLTVHISTSPTSASRADQIVAAMNNSGLPFTASLNPADQNGGGQPPITALPGGPIVTSGGDGKTLDAAGMQITSGGKTFKIDVSGAKTVQDLLNSINNSGAGMEADLNAAKTGIDVRSRVSGADFSIGENGGKTATQLGLRTFTSATLLSQLNHGRGVGVNTAVPDGTGIDFTISETISGVAVNVPVRIAQDSNIGDVVFSINKAAQAAGATFTAQLAATGNGIELSDTNAAASPITVTVNTQSSAAVDLGLVPSGQTSSTATATGNASGTAGSGPNSELLFHAVNAGSAGNVQVVFQAAAITEGNETVNYDPVTGTLTFQISPQTNANDIIAALQNDAAAGGTAGAAFTAALDTSSDPTNDGTGIIQPQQMAMTGGQEVLTGKDTNPQETGSVFTALLNLSAAFKKNDNVAIQQAMTLLGNSMQNLNNARDQLGVREQSLTTINTQITNEQLNLQTALSNNYDTDMASTISNYTAAQIAYQATLQMTASLMRVTLLTYL